MHTLQTDEYINNILEQHSNMVYKLALSQTKKKEDADDVFQEVFVRLVRKRPEFESTEHAKAWLIKVTINCCRKIFSSAWYRRTVALTDEAVSMPEQDMDLLNAVRELPTKYSRVIHLFYYEDMTIAEIGMLLSLSEGTIKSQLCRARNLLKAKLKGVFEDE